MTQRRFPSWGENTRIPEGQTARWQIGPLTLHATNTGIEWQLAWVREKDPLHEALGFELLDGPCESEGMDRKRWGGDSGEDTLALEPMLADRAVVVAPEDALSVPAKGKLMLFVSTPLWLRVRAGGKRSHELMELPVTRLSDTWFGINTQVGEICYSIRTRARTSKEELAPLAHRALTAVTINNQSSQLLDLEQLKVPMTGLALYGFEDGSLWTDAVVLQHDDTEQLTALQIDRKSRPHSGQRQRLASPREPFERQTVMRAFSQLFGQS